MRCENPRGQILPGTREGEWMLRAVHDASGKPEVARGQARDSPGPRTIAQLEYASAIGSLMYAMHCTRPNITFAVCKLSRYTSNPISYCIRKLCNASWMTNIDENKSTSRWVFTLEDGIISWAPKKQICITHSTIESEFIALDAASKEAKWLRNLLLDIKSWPQLMPAISLHCDSQTTISRAYSKVYNDKSRHISLRHEYIRQLIADETITIIYVKSCNNLIDPFTKGLSRDLIKSTPLGLGLRLIS
ncbi:hypothetical protein MANES_08G089011v8 [Manihot esculenta]|uniref:Uncharacterized protein n=1 Tax=Manihot esculenta TaxID=3983 RepID=A0ACB7HBA6_MANES|nr:hypothetical protein MANES_08G089011v8 [Manihot esculenta]